VTLDELRRAAELLPPGASVTLPREALLDAIAAPVSLDIETTGAATWREKLWTCPGDTRLGVPEVAEALNRPVSAVYRAVAKKEGAHRLPASRLGGELVFTAADVRAWIERESVAA
jgi:predicted DNA-binding transcriptional regulator AlpA